MKAPTLASVVARHIEDRVVGAGWPVGAPLGSESELLARYQVSRAVLREAVRIAEHSGVAIMRRGPGGGLVVARPNRDALVAAVGVWCSYQGVTIEEMMQLRRPLLLGAVGMAATRATPEAAASLVRAASDLGSGTRMRLYEPNQMESRIGALSANPALALFIDSLGDLGLQRLRSGWAELHPLFRPAELAAIASAYQRLATAIAAHDPDVALAVAAELSEIFAGRVVDRDQEVGPTISPSQGKLAEQVARALRDDIERAGWPIGSVVGSEIDLLTRFGVSRAIIREAVRILEHHGAARTKRGPGGGLVVTAPDLDAIRRSGMLYLEYAGVTGDAVVEMRTVVEAAMARTAALRISPASADRLRAAIAAEGAAGETVSNFLDFHSELASAAGNRLAQLFVALLSDLVPMHFEESQHSPSAMAAIAVATHRAHERIVEAVVAGDPDAAERRMRRHLVASSDALH